MLLSKATYCAEEHGLRIAHLKAAWIFQPLFASLVADLFVG
jgi:hypothetical protein